jgi:hypothetical protein
MSAEYTPKDNLGFDAFWSPLIFGISDEMAGKLLKALLDFHFNGERVSNLPKTIQPLYEYMVNDIDCVAEDIKHE